MRRIAFYGGSFDPIHRGHLKIAEELTELFELDEFVFVPAFHAPHKTRSKPTSAYHRYAMLCLATRNEPAVRVSKMELDVPDRPYTIETLTKILEETPGDQIFFVMGADSWSEITTWREWEKVLSVVDIIVVTRPNYEIGVSHVTDEIRKRIVDLRGEPAHRVEKEQPAAERIYFTDAVQLEISSTKIRRSIRERSDGWENLVSNEVAKYLKKYSIYES